MEVLIRQTKKIWLTCSFNGITVYLHCSNPTAMEGLANKIKNLPYSEVISAIESEHGFFSAIIQDAERTVIISDRVRSLPLFVRTQENIVIVSDGFFDLLDKSKPLSTDLGVRMELLTAGFVLGERTLAADITQVQAGEKICINNRSGKITERTRYKSVSYAPDHEENYLVHDLAKVVQEVCGALLDFANGRQIVLPLSGGHDSRLLAVTLHEMGCKNLFAFSYGIPGNAEAKVSQLVARSLGIEWTFYPHLADDLAKAWHSPERTRYRDTANNGVSLPHYQDFFAVRHLKMCDMISEDAIFVAGRTGDFISGGQLPSFIFSDREIGAPEIVDHLEKKHFSLWALHRCSCGIILTKVLATGLCFARTKRPPILDDFNLRERQAKYIVNFCRVYEFFGYSWWLPLWDRRFVDFWGKVPLKRKKERRWYIDFVEEKCRRAGLPRLDNAALPGNAIIRRFVKAGLSRIGLMEKASRLKARRHLSSHPLDPNFFFQREYVGRCLSQGALMNGMFSKSLLMELGLAVDSQV